MERDSFSKFFYVIASLKKKMHEMNPSRFLFIIPVIKRFIRRHNTSNNKLAILSLFITWQQWSASVGHKKISKCASSLGLTSFLFQRIIIIWKKEEPTSESNQTNYQDSFFFSPKTFLKSYFPPLFVVFVHDGLEYISTGIPPSIGGKRSFWFFSYSREKKNLMDQWQG